MTFIQPVMNFSIDRLPVHQCTKRKDYEKDHEHIFGYVSKSHDVDGVLRYFGITILGKLLNYSVIVFILIIIRMTIHNYAVTQHIITIKSLRHHGL